VGKPKRSGGGFSAAKPSPAPKQQVDKGSADHAAKERQAVALINQGNLQEAETVYRELIAAGTSNHIVYSNLAAICGMQCRFDELINLLREALELNPNYSEAHSNLGVALKTQGDLAAAIACYNKALELNPNYAEAHSNLGNALREQGNLAAAIASCNKALELKPNYPEAHNTLGMALQEQGDLAAAIACYNKALELKPNYPLARNNLGNVLQEQGELTAAIATYNKALELNPNHPETHNNLGIALKKQGDLNAAIASYIKALEIKPNNPDAHNNLGIALKEQGDLNAAIASYIKALELKPNHPEAHNNLGNALNEQGDLTAAIASYKKALELKPNYPDARWNASLAMLLCGDYTNGWENYEWRAKRSKTTSKPHANPKCNKWDGEALPGEKEQLLIVTEQGLGDTLLFMRYVIALRDQGIPVSLCAQPNLHTLIQASGIDPSPLTPQQGDEITDGLWIPLLSVPRHLEVSPDKPIITEPYIKTTNELSVKWKGILSAAERPIIGINWQGNPQAEKTGLSGRSLQLEAFVPIASGSQKSLVSLQKGFGSEQLETCSFKDCFVSCQDQINDTWDFLETAAIIANCDLVITSDTSVAHLAGGMGKTTWLLLHKSPEWRWGLEGDTSFWYPSMRLFRQSQHGNWDEVMERVAAELQSHFGGLSANTQPT
jgi:tetratricopeptide (TPR) repeat protein